MSLCVCVCVSELELRQQRGLLPRGVLLLTVPDRQEPLGSGGATLNALLVAAEHLSSRAGHTVGRSVLSDLLLRAAARRLISSSVSRW